MKTDSTMIVRDQLYIGGQWVKPAGAGTLDVTNSSTEEVMARIPDGTAADVDRAVAAAKAAFPAWSQTPVAERAAMLQKLSAGLAARMDEIGMLVAQEVGMPLPMAKQIQAGLPTMVMGSYAKLVGEFEYEEKVGNSIVVREPVGVVGCITPWNYPLHQVVAKVAPAIGAGCTVVLKPSEVAPLTAFVLAEIIDQAGLPAGVFNLVTGTGAVVGEAIAAHPDVDMVSFTGSTRAGKRVSELAAKTVKRVALELGGKSANVILDDADFEKAVKTGVGNCYMNSGQTCSAWTRMLVPKERQDEAIAIAKKVAESFTVGDPVKGESRLGPLISDAQQKRVRGYIEKGIAEGATLVTGGAEQPAWPRSRLLREAHRVRQRQERHDDRAGGDLRARALDPSLRGRGGRGEDRQRHHLRARRRRLVEGSRAGQAGGEADAHRPGRHQWRQLQPDGAVRRLQAVGPWSGARKVRARGVSRGQVAADLIVAHDSRFRESRKIVHSLASSTTSTSCLVHGSSR